MPVWVGWLSSGGFRSLFVSCLIDLVLQAFIATLASFMGVEIKRRFPGFHDKHFINYASSLASNQFSLNRQSNIHLFMFVRGRHSLQIHF